MTEEETTLEERILTDVDLNGMIQEVHLDVIMIGLLLMIPAQADLMIEGHHRLMIEGRLLLMIEEQDKIFVDRQKVSMIANQTDQLMIVVQLNLMIEGHHLLMIAGQVYLTIEDRYLLMIAVQGDWMIEGHPLLMIVGQVDWMIEDHQQTIGSLLQEYLMIDEVLNDHQLMIAVQVDWMIEGHPLLMIAGQVALMNEELTVDLHQEDLTTVGYQSLPEKATYPFLQHHLKNKVLLLMTVGNTPLCLLDLINVKFVDVSVILNRTSCVCNCFSI